MKLLSFLFLSILFVVLFSLDHPAKALQKMSFTAEVPPTRIIIVDKNLEILQIISNTRKEVEPTVRIESEKGPELPLTESVLGQYQKIKPTLNFSKIGIIYPSRRENVLDTLYFKNKLSLVLDWIIKLFSKEKVL